MNELLTEQNHGQKHTHLQCLFIDSLLKSYFICISEFESTWSYNFAALLVIPLFLERSFYVHHLKDWLFHSLPQTTGKKIKKASDTFQRGSPNRLMTINLSILVQELCFRQLVGWLRGNNNSGRPILERLFFTLKRVDVEAGQRLGIDIY